MFDVAGKAGTRSHGEAVRSPPVAAPVMPSALQAALNASPKVRQLQAYGDALGRGRASAPPASAIVQMVRWQDVAHDAIEIEGSGGDYTARYQGERAGELQLFEDPDGRQWLNFVEVESRFQGRGIGMSLLDHAVREHGAIYAAVGMQSNEETGDDDTRHLSVEGAALVSSAVRNGILQPQWCFNPAMANQLDDGAEEQSDEHEHDEGHGSGASSEHEEDHESDDEDPDGPVTISSYDVEVTLDDSNTGGIGYEWSMKVTHVLSGNERTIDMHNTIRGEEVLTKEFVGERISQILRVNCVVRKLEIDEL